MKCFVIFPIFLGTFILLFENKYAATQIMEYPGVFYKKIKFDGVHRGSYNMSDCAEQLINCWEIIRPDIICEMNGKEFESICGALRNHCSDKYGPVDYWFHGEKDFPVDSLVCEAHREFTRRYIKIPRNDTRILTVLRALNYTDLIGDNS